MQEVILYVILGLGIGSIYSLTAQGLITIYRGAGILNFAQGAIGTVAAYVYWEMDVQHGVPFGIAFAAGVASSIVIGVVTQVAVIRRLRRGSALARVVATLGVLTLIQSVLEVIFGDNVNAVPSELPAGTIKITSTIQFSASNVILVGIALLVSSQNVRVECVVCIVIVLHEFELDLARHDIQRILAKIVHGQLQGE